MFGRLDPALPDGILALMQTFSADPREHKLDLGVGVYRDANGATPVMRAVREAERQLLQTQHTKSYVSPVGSEPFRAAMIEQVFGADADLSRIRAVQSVGGSGALRILAELLRQSRPNASVHLPEPTWPNHLPLLKAAGLTLRGYPYYDAASGRADVDRLVAALQAMPEGDIVVLHGCCHNPTGADLSPGDWRRVLDVLKSRSLFPFVDLAYQGFGDGLEQDAAAVRLLAAEVPEMAVAASCSKNFGLYRERVGAAFLLGESAADSDRAFATLAAVARSNYSMPPDHGANVAGIVLGDATLRSDWQEELESMRVRIGTLRKRFADEMRKRSNSPRFDRIAGHKGMFSLLSLDAAQIETLRETHGIYVVGGGRINVAGLPDDDAGMASLCDALCAIG